MTNGSWGALLAIGLAGTAGAQGPAEYATVGAIARAHAIDARLHSIIAIDPTAIGQAQIGRAHV